MFPRLLKTPNRCADEIGSRSRNPQVLIKNKNIILLQLAKILEKRSANARASALRKSRMNKKARSHVAALRQRVYDRRGAQSSLGFSSSSITRLSKRLAPPPSMLR